MSQPRTSDYPIDAQFIERWSPRAMANDAIDDQTLLSFLKRRAGRHRPTTFSRGALPTASTVLTAGRTTGIPDRLQPRLGAARLGAGGDRLQNHQPERRTAGGQPDPRVRYRRRLASLAHQAHLKGWLTHCMSGIHHDKIKAALQLPDDYAVHAMVAIGKPGDKARLPDFLQEKRRRRAVCRWARPSAKG